MHKLLGNLPEGLLFVVSAPAGTGKTTLVRMLTDEFDCVVENISYTTRPIRPNEVARRDYFYVSEEEFEKKIQENEFLEYAKVFGHYYGTSLSTVDQLRKKGKHVVLIIDTQGALQIQKKVQAIFVFLLPPNISELRSRLESRKSESTEVVERRLASAKKEMQLSHHYDYLIVNDDIQIAYNVLRSIVIAEEHRLKR